MRELVAPQFKMPDVEWQRIRELLTRTSKNADPSDKGGPLAKIEDRRQGIEGLIDRFRYFENNQGASAQTRDAIKKAHNAARKLRERLDAFDSNAIHILFYAPLPESPLHTAEMLQTAFRAVPDLERRLNAAVSRVPRRPTRSRENLDWLVKCLAQIAVKHGIRITRSEKRGSDSFRPFVKVVVGMANPKIEESSREAAILCAAAR